MTWPYYETLHLISSVTAGSGKVARLLVVDKRNVLHHVTLTSYPQAERERLAFAALHW